MNKIKFTNRNKKKIDNSFIPGVIYGPTIGNTAIKAKNTIDNAKQLTKEGVRNEIQGITEQSLIRSARQTIDQKGADKFDAAKRTKAEAGNPSGPASGQLENNQQGNGNSVDANQRPVQDKKMSTNVYTTVGESANNSSDKTLDFFNSFNKQEINLKSSDVTAFVDLLTRKGMAPETAKQSTNIILKQCNIDEIDPMTIYEELRQTSNMQLTDTLGEILNINRPKSSTLGTAKEKVDNSAKRNIIDGA